MAACRCSHGSRVLAVIASCLADEVAVPLLTGPASPRSLRVRKAHCRERHVRRASTANGVSDNDARYGGCQPGVSDKPRQKLMLSPSEDHAALEVGGAYVAARRVAGTPLYDGARTHSLASPRPSSNQPVIPPIISFTGRPILAIFRAAFVDPLQCGPAQ